MFLRSANLIIISSVLGFLAIAAVALRFLCKRKRKARVTIDDYLIILGLILALSICVCTIIGAAKYRFGNHEIYIESGPLAGWPEAWLLLGYGKIFYALQLLHATAMPIIKASLMIFLRRIFFASRSFEITFWIITIYVFLWWLTTFWMSVFQCWPISSNWGTTPAQMGDCIPDYMTWYAWVALLNVLSDFAIVILPIPLVLRIQMPLRRKLAGVFVLATAIFVVVAGIGRTVGYFTYDHESLDFSYVFYDFLVWTSIEPYLEVIGCCLPTMGHLADNIKFSDLYSWIRVSLSQLSLRHSPSRGTSASADIDNSTSANHPSWYELTEERSAASGTKGNIDNGTDSQRLS
ncbi:uncharacterized protein TRUGW13939_03113 [Talaromyces rugulosus]|uniref:Rhodopsin domain-containing protein n=1 Tax=Talaromyces rugulosus TaxID=121627 RepID=A0A7H8QSA6_TALRU|nr:uncharacterized protein TRUGW13939_03113 [Talaromyces rugulosus]QKX56013.1 hypothetical protein TRUGW13939_03113 [Talaromyces rugulosus]